jgi:16S rRNA (cytidine1402-2'-O)-methyltransferase
MPGPSQTGASVPEPAESSEPANSPRRIDSGQTLNRPGTLYCVPVPLSPDLPMSGALTAQGIEIAARLDAFAAESPKTARAFLKSLPTRHAMNAIQIEAIDARTPDEVIERLLAQLRAGRDLGLMSEAGCPAVADPGARLVLAAQQAGLPVVALIGPSSLLLALMASGLNGQRFAFVGYLPADPAGRQAQMERLQRRSAQAQETQIAIETPYRAQAWFDTALACLAGDTLLTVARAISLPQQSIVTRTVAQWQRAGLELGKSLVVFAFLAQSRVPEHTPERTTERKTERTAKGTPQARLDRSSPRKASPAGKASPTRIGAGSQGRPRGRRP